MQPKIASIIYVSFVFFLFWVDRRKYGKMSYAQWLPLIWIMYCGSRAVSYWLGLEIVSGSEFDYTGGNPIDRAFLSVLMAVGVLVLWKRKIEWKNIIGGNGWIFALFLYVGASFLWSDFAEVSFKRFMRAVGDLIMVMIVATDADPPAAVRRLLLRCSFVLIPMSVLLVKYYHDLGISYNAISGVTMWIGVATHKNQLGQLACVCSINAIWQIANTWRDKDISFCNTLVILLMSLWLLNGPAISTSKTSIFVFFLSLTFLLISGLFRNRSQYLGIFILFGAVSFGILNTMFELLTGSSFISLIVSSAGRDMTLTGRTALWEELWKIGALHPILGVGYGSFWLGNIEHDLLQKFTWGPESAHNGYLDVYLELGIIGLVILSGAVISVYKNITRMLPVSFDFGRIRLIFLVMVLIYNITESSLIKTTNLLWFLFLLFGLYGSKNVTNQEFVDKKQAASKTCSQPECVNA